MKLDLSLIASQAADTRSMLLWTGSLKDSIQKAETISEDEKAIKQSIASKLESLESDLLSISSFVSDVEAAFEDPIIMDELLCELKA